MSTTNAGLPKSHRRDIQGLRTIAVLAVFAEHLWGKPVGGFVGVDIFFVISGFLITGQLLNHNAKAGISFADFYRRRLRRIIPAAVLVLVTTVAATYLLLNSARGRTVLEDGAWSFSFAANWHFASIGTDYWANDGLTSPLQHYWSLSVEEQFYVFWPWLIVATLGFSSAKIKGNLRARRQVLVGAMTVIVTLSFVYSVWHTQTAPMWAYFGTFDRAWELGVGALLAVARPNLARLSPVVSAFLAWAGLVGIVASMFLISDSTTFPTPFAAVPVLATAAIVAAGCGPEPRFMVLLTNPMSGYIGNISYSLYLWHFPVIILSAAFFAETSALSSAAIIVVSMALASATYHFIEHPIHESSWLEPRKRPRTSTGTRADVPARIQYTSLGLLAIVTAALCLVALNPKETAGSAIADRIELPVSTDPDSVPSGAQFTGLVGVQQQRLQQSLDLDSFPEFKPGIDTLGIENWARNLQETGCADVTPDNYLDCRWGQPIKGEVVVIGDSYAMSWTPGIRAALVDDGYQVQQLTLGQCPAWDIAVTRDAGDAFPECDTFHDWATQTAVSLDPDIVILATADTTLRRLTNGAGSAGVTTALASSLEALPATTRKFVLSAPPATGNLQQCATQFGRPSDCVEQIDDQWRTISSAERTAADSAGATYVDTSPWFCVNQACPAFVGATPGRVDGFHITQQLSEQLAPLLKEVLLDTSTQTG
jgi:peptidoglycan/LPS O-acetylase OafA/YrhL